MKWDLSRFQREILNKNLPWKDPQLFSVDKICETYAWECEDNFKLLVTKFMNGQVFTIQAWGDELFGGGEAINSCPTTEDYLWLLDHAQ